MKGFTYLIQEFENWLRKEKLLSLIKLLNVQLYLPKSEFDINDNKINWRMEEGTGSVREIA